MDFEDLIKNEQIVETDLLDRTQRIIAKYRALEPTPEEKVIQEINDLNDIIVNDIVEFIANKRAKEEAEAKIIADKEIKTKEETAKLEAETKHKNVSLMQRLAARYKPSKR